MLTQITINNFTIIDHLDITFNQGMTVITGETGAGKSILLDAVGLILGNRAEANLVRPNTEKTDITAIFSLAANTPATHWLTERDLNNDDECILRRVITQEGRSRGYINGQPTTLQDLKALGEMLIDIHGQHAHQSLLRKDQQRCLLDEFAGCTDQVNSLAKLYSDWQHKETLYQQQLASLNEQKAKEELLSFQIEELSALELTSKNELEAIENEHQQLSHADSILLSGQQALQASSESDNSLLSQLNQIQQRLNTINIDNHQLNACKQLFTDANIHISEASSELKHYLDNVEVNPEQLQQLDNKLQKIYQMARKYNVSPSELPALTQQLSQTLFTIENSDEDLAKQQQAITQLKDTYIKDAAKISKKRKQASKRLDKKVTELLHQLGMPDAQFNCQLSGSELAAASQYGLETVEFLIQTNPGQPLSPITKIASGGELSRISLAIQVATISQATIPSLIFDEADVGIGGATAEIVGKLLRQLSGQSQVLCVTHLPQVAAQSHHHFYVSKYSKNKQAHTKVTVLSAKEKTEEIARMLGGVKLSKQSLAHAQSLLADISD